VVALDLAAEAQAWGGEAAEVEDGFFGFGHFGGFAGDELNAAGGAPSLAAAGVKLIDLRFVSQCEHEALACGDFKAANILNREFGHEAPSGE
jgi:hypothetical protein